MTFDYQELFTAFYQKVDPEKIKSVSDLLLKYKGREAALFDRMCIKYGIDGQDFLNSMNINNQNSDYPLPVQKTKTGLIVFIAIIVIVIIFFVLKNFSVSTIAQKNLGTTGIRDSTGLSQSDNDLSNPQKEELIKQQLTTQIIINDSIKNQMQTELNDAIIRLDMLKTTNVKADSLLKTRDKEIEGLRAFVQRILNNKNATAAQLANAKAFISQLKINIETYSSEIDKIEVNNQPEVNIKTNFDNVNQVITYQGLVYWGNKYSEYVSSSELHFNYAVKDTVWIEYHGQCMYSYPIKIINNEIVVYWDNNMDCMFDIGFRIMPNIQNPIKGEPFMILSLQNDTLIAKYLYPDWVSKMNKKTKSYNADRVMFPKIFINYSYPQ